MRNTSNIMKTLRELNRSLENALKINEWVDSLIEESILGGKSITLITPWSLSRSFVKRHKEQGGCFSPTKAEIKLFEKEIPTMSSILKDNGISFNWWLIFSRSYIRENAMSEELEEEYAKMISDLVDSNSSELLILNWEDDILGYPRSPNSDLLAEVNFAKLVDQKKFQQEIARRMNRARSTLDLEVSEEIIIQETKFKICCEAEEGRFLIEDPTNPLCDPGEFLFLILGRAERYEFFSTLCPEFQQRIVCVLKPYPWRMS